MARRILGYVNRRPIWSQNEPAHAHIVSHGGLPLSMALTSVTTVKPPRSQPNPLPFLRQRPLCGAWMPRNQETCARTPEHMGDHQSGRLLDEHMVARRAR